MAMNVRHPLWLPASTAPGMGVFSVLFFIETVARASLATVVPLQAYDILQDEQQVSFLYTCVAISTLTASFLIPALIRRFTRRWTYTIGIGALIAAALALWSYTLPGQAAGMFLRVFGTACLNITLNLYIMEFIRKQDYVKNDARRLAYSTVGWTLAPYFGVWLYTNHGIAATYGWAIAWALILAAAFWYLRIAENTAIRSGVLKPINPIANLGRFVSQPRLRMAWFIAFARSCFWTTFFVYTPILMVASGLGKEAGALVISAGNAVLVLTLAWQRIAAQRGIRWSIWVSFLALAAMLAATWAAGIGTGWAAAGFLVGGCIAATGLDAIGAVPFYRAVHASERPEMTAVYRTYLDASELLPTLVYGVLLTWFDLPSVFLALSLLMLAAAGLSARYLHRRL
ncbi:MAG TPA: MFS transporter [Thermohalobaculum sp.]|nr:MFS transporter [Thermohalobaculum sp.]